MPGDDVELYQRTYSTLLRSRGETKLRILESSHRAMNSSLHPLAASEELDLGAFLYAIARLPRGISTAKVIVLGQDLAQFQRAGMGAMDDWPEVEAVARRRRWHQGPDGTWAVLLSSTSDVDDLIPTLVAYQIEWRKLRTKLTAVGIPEESSPAACAAAYGGAEDDWVRLQEAWGGGTLPDLLKVVRDHSLSWRIRSLGYSSVGYARMTRRWWQPVRTKLDEDGLFNGPLYFISSNTHSLVNLLSGDAVARERELVEWVETAGPADLQEELRRFREDRTPGSWNNFLFFLAREAAPALPGIERDLAALGITHMESRTALRVAAQIIPLAKVDPARLDDRIGPVDADALRRSDAVVVNVDYPLGLAAYNLLREITEDIDRLKGVYILGKAATLNANVGDVMISSVVYDEHSRSTYWLDNAFEYDDIAPFLRFGSGLDNQRAVTVKSTFLQNRDYLDYYYREQFTVVEMEAGPYCDAIHEITSPDRYPVGAQVNFSKLPLDFGVVHYASDTPYTQARTLGARGMSYYGMDSTYATSIAILRRIFQREGALES